MLKIVTLPAKSLRERSKEIDRDFLLSDKIQKLIDEMVPAMYKYDGVGLAAPQIGENIRICVIAKMADKKLKNDLILVNPVWEKISKKKNTDTEGCLSVPNVFGKVIRYSDIHVEALDRTGNKISFDAKKFFARVIQHECDHLNGILFIDKATDMCTIKDGKEEALCDKNFDEKHTLKI